MVNLPLHALPVCPKCGSTNLVDSGRDEVSRYTRETLHHAYKCKCGNVFVVGITAETKPATQVQIA